MDLSSMSFADLSAELEEIEERALDCWTASGMANLRTERDAVRAEMSLRASTAADRVLGATTQTATPAAESKGGR